jgi:NTP pyrophosphatase (non-canonical NTP hydrolase)
MQFVISVKVMGCLKGRSNLVNGENRMPDHESILEKIRDFRDQRDWMKFHHPKELAAGIAIEAAELMELFLWKDLAEQAQVVEEKRERIEEEIADVGLFLLELADNLDIDLWKAIDAKLAKNADKYPVAKAKGRNVKYTDL